MNSLPCALRPLRFSCFASLVAVALVVPSCQDATGENLPGGGFTGGTQLTTANSTPGTLTNETASATQNLTTNDPTATSIATGPGATTKSTTDTTVDPTVDPTVGPTVDPTTDSTDPSDTTGGGATTDDPTTDTGPVAECGNGSIEAGEVCFDGAPGTFAAGDAPTDVVEGDFNGDNDMDVATSNAGGTINVLFGNGAGTLGAPNATATGNNPVRIGAGLLNAGANSDIVVVNAGSNNFAVHFGVAGGAGAATFYAVGGDPRDLAIVALGTADNSIDIVVANVGDADYHTALNDGNGNFTLAGPWNTGDNPGASGIAVGQIAASADVDIWIAGGGTYGATPGNADGSIAGLVLEGMVGTDLGIAMGGDVNADGDMDVVVIDQTDDAVYVLIGDGPGGAAGFMAVPLDAGADPAEAVFADVTGEGQPDVVACSAAENSVTVFAGDGMGGFAAGVSFDVGTNPSGVAAADLDGDGVADIIVSNRNSNNVTVLYSNP